MKLKTILQTKANAIITEKVTDTVSSSLKNFISIQSSSIMSRMSRELKVTYSEETLRIEKFLRKLDTKTFDKYSILRLGNNFKSFPTLKENTVYALPLPKKVTLIVYKDGPATLRLYFLGNASAVEETLDFFQRKVRGEDTTLELSTTSQIWCHIGRFDNEGELKLSCNGRHIMKPIDELFTTQENKDHIVNYLNRWKEAEQLFQKLGVVHKVGILLYGPPGTGKTSMAKAIAHILKTDLVTLDVSNFPTKVPDLSKIPDHTDEDSCVVLLEDIDYLFKDIEGNQAKINALLQTLDGANSDSNFVFIATTNDIGALNPALIRDGRFDLKIHMDDIGDEATACQMCRSCQLNEDQIDELLSDIKYPVNPAYLQNICIKKLFASMGSDEQSEEGRITTEEGVSEGVSEANEGTNVESDERSEGTSVTSDNLTPLSIPTFHSDAPIQKPKIKKGVKRKLPRLPKELQGWLHKDPKRAMEAWES